MPSPDCHAVPKFLQPYSGFHEDRRWPWPRSEVTGKGAQNLRCMLDSHMATDRSRIAQSYGSYQLTGQSSTRPGAIDAIATDDQHRG